MAEWLGCLPRYCMIRGLEPGQCVNLSVASRMYSRPIGYGVSACVTMVTTRTLQLACTLKMATRVYKLTNYGRCHIEGSWAAHEPLYVIPVALQATNLSQSITIKQHTRIIKKILIDLTETETEYSSSAMGQAAILTKQTIMRHLAPFK